MHSRIFQVSKDFIEREDYIDESYYYDHWFVGQIADYVRDSDRAGDLDWLASCARGYEVGTDELGEYLMITNKEIYFTTKFALFTESLNKAKEWTLSDFANGTIVSDWWRFLHLYEDKYGFYIECDGDELMTLDTFIRYADVNVKYYLGGTVDYHC